MHFFETHARFPNLPQVVLFTPNIYSTAKPMLNFTITWSLMLCVIINLSQCTYDIAYLIAVGSCGLYQNCPLSWPALVLNVVIDLVKLVEKFRRCQRLGIPTLHQTLTHQMHPLTYIISAWSAGAWCETGWQVQWYIQNGGLRTKHNKRSSFFNHNTVQ